ncbi:zf-CCCH domain-containing protein/zf-RING_2 domain-containing protein [Cephalotus follicularis]|uniref:Zf-CCCH domain-containing protein/zf-RING_2 domain-containing protein n=1 Tax=Cephalotus follicularis TaxID=3775 RepID=A0A1Q3BXN7_CEPFO|nr:zf-CCCH domain-containing protein/zf-RING_2 domain-containing protein [Cephalotus follicularis]
MSKRVLCKFFAHGACLKGEHCEYSHDWKDPTNNICTYYQKGICSYGSRCRYEHVKASLSDSSASSSSLTVPPRSQALDSVSQPRPSRASSSRMSTAPATAAQLSASSSLPVPSIKAAWNLPPEQHDFLDNGDFRELRNVKPADRPLCSYAAAGDCLRGENCPHIHGDLCPTCGKHCLHPFRPEEREEHIKMCEKKQNHIEALKCSQEIECSVCLDRVLSKPTAAERKFGLLSECDHPFCISCIRNWRSNSPTSGMDVNTAVRACPICRKLSYFVIPSVIWYSSKEEKQEIVDSYKAKLKSIDCKHFNFGNGNCPFGTSCFYRHTVKPGSYVWKYQRPPPRRLNGVNTNALFDVFDDLIGEDEWDIFDEDFDDGDLGPLTLAMLLMHMDSEAGESSDEENYSF